MCNNVGYTLCIYMCIMLTYNTQIGTTGKKYETSRGLRGERIKKHARLSGLFTNEKIDRQYGDFKRKFATL